MRWLIALALPFLFGFNLPRGSTVDVVGEGFIQNGMQMDIYHYSHRDTPDAFSSDLQSILQNEAGEIVTKVLDDGVLSVGLLTDKNYISVTIQGSASGGSEGFLTKTNLRPKRIPDPPIQLPNSLRLISHTFDPLGQETWVFNSKRDLVWVRNLLLLYDLREEHMSADGSTFYKGVVGRSRLQVSVSALDNGTGLVIVK